MASLDKEYKFEKIYQLAAQVELYVDHSANFGFGEMDWSVVSECLIKPCKDTVFHHFIHAIICYTERENFSDNGDLYVDSYFEDGDNASINRVYQEFDVYHLNYEKLHMVEDDREYEAFDSWLQAHEPQFEKLWEIWTYEVFHLLYSNRTILTKFNARLAEYWRENPSILTNHKLSRRGKISRIRTLPSWLKTAVFFRDKGRCVYCNKDLTGLVDIKREIQYDHIIPLNLGGTNDPTNIQLLCGQCNQDKSGSKATTSYRYRAWWDY